MTEKNRRDAEPGRPTAGREPAPGDHTPAAGGPLPSRPSGPAGADAGEPTVEQTPGTPGGPLPPGPPDDHVTAEPAGGEAAPPSPERVITVDDAPGVPDGDLDDPAAEARPAPWRRLSSAGALIWVLLALFGFTLVVQLRSNDGDQGLATARQEDLVRILSDLEARDSRLQSEIAALEYSQRQLTSGVAGRQAALAEAAKRADELGLLAGTVPGSGPGLRIVMSKVKASAVLNAVQELRGAGGEVMQVAGLDGTAVRIVASSYFVDGDSGGLVVDDIRLSGPYVLEVIGSPPTMQTALQIPGGVVASVNSGGGSVTVEQRSLVEVTALRKATTLQYARPVS